MLDMTENEQTAFLEIKERLSTSLFRFLLESIDILSTKYGSSYISHANYYSETLKAAFGNKSWPDWPVDGFVAWTRAILREENYFDKFDVYSRSIDDFSFIKRNIYENPAVMEDYYLVGLYLTYILWPHQYELLSFFIENFITPYNGNGKLSEWGIGHGLLSLTALNRWKNTHLLGYDISPYSLNFAQKILSQAGHNDTELKLGDVIETPLDQKCDYIICGELLEHVANPEGLLRKASDCLLSGGKLFLTTAINAPQEDHIVLFRSLSEVVELLEQSFSILTYDVSTHPNREKDSNPPQVAAFVLENR